MAWERRARGGLYYTRSRRVRGRVVREYVGTGIIGEIAAIFDAEDREERQARREEIRAEHEQARAVSASLADLEAVTRRAVEDVLHAEGFHRHKGQWRRRRVTSDD